MTSFDFDVIGDTPRLVSRPPDGAATKPVSKTNTEKAPQPAAKQQPGPVDAGRAT